MELRQLRYLIGVAEEGSFTRAGEKLFVTQSALSQQIMSLEQEVGTLLVDRSKRGIRLTAAGAILCHHAQRILLELEQAAVAIEELEGLQRGELRVGVVQTVNDYLMPALATQFAAAYPQVKLLIEECSSDDIERRLDRGEIQVGLGFLPVSDPGIETAWLFEERLSLIVRRDHRWSGREAIPVRSLDKLPMVMLSNTFCTRRLWEENARLATAQPQVVMEMNTVSSILAVVEETGIATVLPRLTLARQRSGRLVGIALSDPSPARQVGVLWHRDTYLCSASRAFIQVAQEASAHLQPDSLPPEAVMPAEARVHA